MKIVPSLGRSFDSTELVDQLRSALRVEQVRVDAVSRLEPEPSLKYRLTASSVAAAPELP